MAIIQRDRSIIPACDVDLDLFEKIVRETSDVEGVGGYKIPAISGRKGWETWVATAREHTNKPLILDPQKAGTDIPDTGKRFMEEAKGAGFDAVILFPQSGPVTEYEWILAAQVAGLGVIVGGEMTHPRYMEEDCSSQGKMKNYTQIFEGIGMAGDLGGFIREGAPEDMYGLAARMDVTDFVVPGNKPDRIEHHKARIIESGVTGPVFYAPGLIAQGGKISEGGKAAGERFHAIVGRGIYGAADIRQAAEELTSQL